MSESDSDPGDRAMLWFNLIGGTIALALLGSFFFFYGERFFSFVMLMFGGGPAIPDR